MQKNIKKRRKYIGAMVSAAVMVAFLGLVLAMLMIPLLMENLAGTIVHILLGGYAILLLSIIVGILLALRQRLKEIEACK